MTERLLALLLAPAWLACSAGWAGACAVLIPLDYVLERLP